MKKVLVALVAVLIMAFAGLVSAAVDINSATVKELEAVKGIGPAKAKAIIDYREKNGPFKSVDDLKKVKGFGGKTLEKMRPELTVGETPSPAAKPPVPAPSAAPAPMPKPAPAAPSANPAQMPKPAPVPPAK